MNRIDLPEWFDKLPEEQRIRWLFWYGTFISPVNIALDNAKKVYFEINPSDPYILTQWMAHKTEHDGEKILDGKISHQALLINIEPIEQESCADLIKEIMDGAVSTDIDWYERAKAALEREDAENN